MTATDRLRAMLDERRVEWEALSDQQEGDFTITATRWHDSEGGLLTMFISEPHGSTWDFFWLPTPEQAIAATLGREPWVDPTWERWHKSLRHDEIKSIGDAVEQLMYEAIEFGGDMGPNGNTYNGIDEGDVLTAGFINEWVARFEATLGSGTCEADETDLMPFVRADSDGSDVDYIHVMECSSCGGTYEYVNGSYEFCPRCGREVVDE